MIPQPISKPYDKSHRILLIDYYITLPSGLTIVVKAGLIYDGASFPAFLYTWFRPFSPEFEPFAVFHDACFQRELTVLEDGTEVTLKIANQIGVEICKMNGVHAFKVWAIQSGLMLGSWIPWYFNSNK